MKKIKLINVIYLFLGFIFSWFKLVQSSLPEGTLVATSTGLVKVEKLKIGDKVLSYNFNSTKTETILTEVKITKIDKCLLEAGFSIYTEKYRWIDSSPQHLFFVLKAGEDKEKNISVMADFVQAQYLNAGDMLIDVDMSCIPITKIRRADCCTIKFDKKKRPIKIQTVKIYAYGVEVEEPHTFLISEKSEYANQERRLLLTHNGLPALAVGASWIFGSTSASISFAEASLSVGGGYVSLGPVGFALGVFTGVGIVGYNYFFGDKKKGGIYLERVDPNCRSGRGGPKDPKKGPNDRIINTVTKVEFFRQLKDQYEYWKDGIYRLKDRAMGLLDGKAHYLQWDNLHNDVEVYNKGKTHLGSIDPKTLQLYKAAVYNRRM